MDVNIQALQTTKNEHKPHTLAKILNNEQYSFNVFSNVSLPLDTFKLIMVHFTDIPNNVLVPINLEYFQESNLDIFDQWPCILFNKFFY